MRYSGGKEKIAGKVAAVLQPHVDAVGAYWEPFLGGASVFARVKARVKYGSDVNPWLMCMWQAVADGWVPPSTVTVEDYARLKAEKPMVPETAFVGFGCSFGGKWFGGFARSDGPRNYAENAASAIKCKLKGFGNCHLATGSFSTVETPEPCVVYCDPPYAGVLGYGVTGTFDSAAFWDGVRAAERAGWPTFVSEYTAPDDFEVVAEFRKQVQMSKVNGYKDKGEKLFRLRKDL